MTKKDYEAIAGAFARTIADLELECDDEFAAVAENYIDRLADRIASVCEADNGRFDRRRFLNACERG